MSDEPQVLVEFPLCALTDVPVVVRTQVVMRPSSHDIAVLTLAGSTIADRLVSGAPVVVTWGGSNTDSARFYGYVYKVSPRYGGQPVSRVVCVGLSYPLMNQQARVWTDVTAAVVVRELAREAQMSADVADGGREYAQVVQKVGESAWQLLTRLADTTGNVLRVEGSTLVFRDRADFTRTFRPGAPVLTYGSGAELMRFEAAAGSYTPELGATNSHHLLFGLDQSGVLISDVQGAASFHETMAPVFQRVEPGALSSVEEANEAKRALAERNRFHIQAKAECTGKPQLAPEREVYINGLSGRWNGYWTIREVTHVLSRDGYRCDLMLGTDGLGDALLLPNETSAPPVVDVGVAQVNPHLEGTLGWPYSDPVLRSSTPIVGDPGRPLVDFAWSARVVSWR